MSRRFRTLGWTVCALAGLTVTGCVSARAELLDSIHHFYANDLQEPETPRLSRSQLSEPPSRGISVGRPEPPLLQPAGNFQPEPAPALAGLGAGAVKVRAWVNGKPIFDDDIYAFIYPALLAYQQYPEPERSKKQADIFNKVLQEFIDQELLYQDAIAKIEKANPKFLKELKKVAKREFEEKVRKGRMALKITEEKFADELRRQGLNMTTWERMEERKFISNEYVRSRVIPLVFKETGRPQLYDYYFTHLSDFQRKDSVKWQDIFVLVGAKHPTPDDALQHAQWLVTRLSKGEDFANLLQEDDGDSKQRNGEGIGQRRGEIRPAEVEQVLFELKEGEVGPPIELSTGFHVVRVVKRDYAGQIPFNEETQRIIQNKLRPEIYERELKRLLHDLRSRAVIEIEKN